MAGVGTEELDCISCSGPSPFFATKSELVLGDVGNETSHMMNYPWSSQRAQHVRIGSSPNVACEIACEMQPRSGAGSAGMRDAEYVQMSIYL